MEGFTKGGGFWRDMGNPELSLGPSLSSCNYEDFGGYSLHGKRKMECGLDQEPMIQTNIDLQLQSPLPPDWEQCLDLQSGRMYYLNRRTMRKTWERPLDHKLDLDLNISTPHISCERSNPQVEFWKSKRPTTNMVAVPCLNCHLLVMLCTSSPSCPNCKYYHSLPALERSPPGLRVDCRKKMETLSLLN